MALRLVIRGTILFAGTGKVTGEPFDAGGYLVHGVDAYVERIQVGGQALIERFPPLRYLLG